MSQPGGPITFRIDASSKANLPPERIDDAVRELQDELRELHVSSIQPVAEAAPPGTKSAEAFTLGSLLIAVAPELVKQAVNIIVGWLQRDPSRVIRIRDKDGGPTYEVTGAWKAADLAEMMKVLARQESRSTHAP